MKDILALILSGQFLSEPVAANALRLILAGEIPAPQAASFLAIIQSRGMNLAELRGFLAVLREQGKSLNFSEFEIIDVCGTGGDGKHTFNISTVSAFVLAGADFKVAKHGNASATSGCGSSDVLQNLGVKFTDDEKILKSQLEIANVCYLHAPLFQPALKTVATLRSEIGFRTFFNLLGPLLNPARPRFQFIGVFEPAVLRLYRYFLEDEHVNFALVHTREGYDEISLTGAFDVITNDGAETFYPEDLGFQTFGQNDLRGGETAAESAQQFLQIVRSQGTAAQNAVVIANSAFAMRLSALELSFDECRARASESLFSGAAWRAFEKMKSVRV